MHPSRVTDRLARLRKLWLAIKPTDHHACQQMARQIGGTDLTWERIGIVLDVCEHLWLSWQHDMQRAHNDVAGVTAVLREAGAPYGVRDGSLLVDLMRKSVQYWGARRLAEMTSRHQGLRYAADTR